MGMAHLIIDNDQTFDVMREYYRMFPFEMSTKSHWTHKLQAPVRIPNMTFETLLDEMIKLRRASPKIDHFVLVVHGLIQNNVGLGLLMPITSGTRMMCSSALLKPLIDLRNEKAADLEDFEKNFTFTNPSRGLNKVTFPKGSVVRIVKKMRDLQKLKVRWLELRACNLGANEKHLSIVGESFGARFAIAPNVHMFYVKVDVARGLNRGATFARMLQRLRRARSFTNGSDQLAIEITSRGPGRFTNRAVTNSANLKWFTQTSLWSQNSYRNGTTPQNFPMAGMELPGGSFALPQEQAYRDHLVDVGPLKGNLI